MIKKLLYVLMLLVIKSALFAQQRPDTSREQKPVFHEVSNKDVVTSIYPDAVKVEKVNGYWYAILNAKNKAIGYAMNSTPYCKDVIGYNSATPVIIITDKNWIIKKVALLSNWETTGFVKKLEKKGFFELWVEKSVKEAQSVKLDAYTGATFTAMAVSKNVNLLLNEGIKKLPKSK